MSYRQTDESVSLFLTACSSAADRGQAEAKCLRPRPRPKLWGRGQKFGLEALTSPARWPKRVRGLEAGEFFWISNLKMQGFIHFYYCEKQAEDVKRMGTENLANGLNCPTPRLLAPSCIAGDMTSFVRLHRQHVTHVSLNTALNFSVDLGLFANGPGVKNARRKAKSDRTVHCDRVSERGRWNVPVKV